jgi:uncharacterized protein RhaS with RHS repeats
VGRFISEDPAGFGGGDVNLYAYVQNNPIMLVDPLGLSANERADWAISQLQNNSSSWGRFSGVPFQLPSWKCNEFVYAVHSSTGSAYPTVLRENGYFKPNVSDLAEQSFATNTIEYLSIQDVKRGDVVVWFDASKGIHHTGIAVGNNKVVHASTFGLKMSSIENIFPGTNPIVRRSTP